jgi:hypothetical protein
MIARNWNTLVSTATVCGLQRVGGRPWTWLTDQVKSDVEKRGEEVTGETVGTSPKFQEENVHTGIGDNQLSYKITPAHVTWESGSGQN